MCWAGGTLRGRGQPGGHLGCSGQDGCSPGRRANTPVISLEPHHRDGPAPAVRACVPRGRGDGRARTPAPSGCFVNAGRGETAWSQSRACCHPGLDWGARWVSGEGCRSALSRLCPLPRKDARWGPGQKGLLVGRRTAGLPLRAPAGAHSYHGRAAGPHLVPFKMELPGRRSGRTVAGPCSPGSLPHRHASSAESALWPRSRPRPRFLPRKCRCVAANHRAFAPNADLHPPRGPAARHPSGVEGTDLGGPWRGQGQVWASLDRHLAWLAEPGVSPPRTPKLLCSPAPPRAPR